MTQIWVDADAIPGVIKEILFRAADREKIITTFIANRLTKIPSSTYIENYQVLHEDGLRSKTFPRYNGCFKDSVLMFKAQRQILKWVLGEDFG